jgi:uncharacterized membrane protein (UPF0127 family)
MTTEVLIRNCGPAGSGRQGSRPVLARYCSSFLCRLIGLTFRKSIPSGWGLLLVEKRENRLDTAIHMLGVWTDLAVVWIDSRKKVVDVRLARRWRPAYVPAHPAKYVLEMAPEHLNDFHIGDQLEFDLI